MANRLFKERQRVHRMSRKALIYVAIGLLLSGGAMHLNAQTWNLQWSDEFNGSAGAAPSSSNWTYDTGGGGWGNGELETYCAPYSNALPCNPNSSNIYQDGDGNLVIQAIKGTPHETEIYVRLQRVDVMFSIVYPDSDNELRPVQERRIFYLDLAD